MVPASLLHPQFCGICMTVGLRLLPLQSRSVLCLAGSVSSNNFRPGIPYLVYILSMFLMNKRKNNMVYLCVNYLYITYTSYFYGFPFPLSMFLFSELHPLQTEFSRETWRLHYLRLVLCRLIYMDLFLLAEVVSYHIFVLHL